MSDRDVSAVVSASFTQTDANSFGGLTIEGDPGVYGDTLIHLLLFPAVGAQVACDVGTVRLGDSKPVPVDGGVIQITNGSSASLDKPPVYSNPVFQVMYAFDANGEPIHGLKISYDPVTRLMTTNVQCTCSISYTAYTTAGREIIYTPAVQQYGVGQVTKLGTIVAYYDGAQTSYETQLYNVDDGSVETEMYRIVSNAVTTQDGEFEKPPNYPADGNYPNGASIDISKGSIMTERVHEIGMIREDGYVRVVPYFVRKLPPYDADVTYKPTKSCKTATLPDTFTDDIKLKAQAYINSKGYGCKNK